MDRVSGTGAGRGEKRPSEDPLDAARKKVESEFELLQSLQLQAAQCYRSIAANAAEASIIAATLPATPATVGPAQHQHQQEEKPTQTLLDFAGFSKSRMLGDGSLITFHTTAAAEGTTVTSARAGTGPSLQPGERQCKYASKGCKKVLRNPGAATRHEGACEFAKLRSTQLSIRPMVSMLGLMQRPRVHVEDADKMARQQSLPARVAELPPEKKERLKLTKSGKVDMRTFNTGATTRRNYSPLFKARALRAYDHHGNWDDVAKELGMRIQETLLVRCGGQLAMGMLNSVCKSCRCREQALTGVD